MKRLILYFKQWNCWRKCSKPSSKIYKIMVLLKIVRSPSFEFMRMGERIEMFTTSMLTKLSDCIDMAAIALSEVGKSINETKKSIDDMYYTSKGDEEQ